MFWTIFEKLCALKGLSPNAVAKELHIASGTVSEWKKGRTPQNATLKKIADYFAVSVEYLKGETDEKEPAEKTQATILPLFSNEEISIIYAYRAQPELQSAVKRLLGFTEGTAYDAAKSKTQPFEKQKLNKIDPEQSAKLHNAPEDSTDIM